MTAFLRFSNFRDPDCFHNSGGLRHPGESRGLVFQNAWIPAFAGMAAVGLVFSPPVFAASKKADAETLKMARFFIRTEVGQLPPEQIPAFIAIDAGSLPASLLDGFFAKREELLALKKIADGRLKPRARLAGTDAEPPKDDACKPLKTPHAATVLKTAGYGAITPAEENYLEGETKCSECELAREFTLRLAIEPKKGKASRQKPEMLYFLHEQDPLWALIGSYRDGRKNPFGTNFFGAGHPGCR